MLFIWLVALGAFILDQVTKILAVGFFTDPTQMLINGMLSYQGQSVEIIPKALSFTYVLNNGAAFGILKNQRLFFLLATVAVCCAGVIVLLRIPKKHILLKLASGFIFGGAIGNLIDRFFIGVVRDFIEVTLVETVTGYAFPVFNVADMFVVVGVILLAIYILFIHDKYTGVKNDKADS